MVQEREREREREREKGTPVARNSKKDRNEGAVDKARAAPKRPLSL